MTPPHSADRPPALAPGAGRTSIDGDSGRQQRTTASGASTGTRKSFSGVGSDGAMGSGDLGSNGSTLNDRESGDSGGRADSKTNPFAQTPRPTSLPSVPSLRTMGVAAHGSASASAEPPWGHSTDQSATSPTSPHANAAVSRISESLHAVTASASLLAHALPALPAQLHVPNSTLSFARLPPTHEPTNYSLSSFPDSAFPTHAAHPSRPVPPTKLPRTALHTGQGRFFRDHLNRATILRGINIGGSSKTPSSPRVPSHVRDSFFDVRNTRECSFVDRPLALDEADAHLERLRRWGVNFVRLNVTWEAVEHGGPGIIDHAYIAYVVALVSKMRDKGMRCFIDPHQDVWSRFSGGSGAPHWTFLAAGLDPSTFQRTGAAVVHNTFGGVEWEGEEGEFPKMIWPTNYHKLAPATMFTLFFGGSVYAPRIVHPSPTCSPHFHPSPLFPSQTLPGHHSSKGLASDPPLVSMQDFLQHHYMSSLFHLYAALVAAGLTPDTVIGFDTLNEPSHGYIGLPSISALDPRQEARNGPTPTALQSFALGEGAPVEVEKWAFGPMGPAKVGNVRIDPAGKGCWTSQDRFGDVQPGCIWRAHGVWEPTPTGPSVLRDGYFAQDPRTGRPADFLRDFWVPFVRAFGYGVRGVDSLAVVFVEPPVMTAPPEWGVEEFEDEEETGDGPLPVVVTAGGKQQQHGASPRPLLLDPPGVHVPARRLRAATEASVRSTASVGGMSVASGKALIGGEVVPLKKTGKDATKEGKEKEDPRGKERLCYAPHWYDGLTLMSKHWRGWFTVDYLNYVRGKYTLLGAIRIGWKQTKRGFVEPMQTLADEGQVMMGPHPTLIGEFGIPFDLDDRATYALPYPRAYTAQVSALDYNMTGIERSLVSCTLWCYCPDNVHRWGDGWNGEDLSVFCAEEREEGVAAVKVWDDAQLGGRNGMQPEATTAAVVAVRRRMREEARQQRKKREVAGAVKVALRMEVKEGQAGEDGEDGVPEYTFTRTTTERVPVALTKPSLVDIGEEQESFVVMPKASVHPPTQSAHKDAHPFVVHTDEAPTGEMSQDELDALDLGGRALDALARPYPVYTPGDPERVTFSMKDRTFRFSYSHALPVTLPHDVDPTQVGEFMVAEIFMPRWQYPDKKEVNVRVSAGEWRWVEEREAGEEEGMPLWDDMVSEWKGKGGAPRFRCSAGGVRKILWRCGCWDACGLSGNSGQVGTSRVSHDMVVMMNGRDERGGRGVCNVG
ncbi:glycoside hydrolase family 5 protein [Gonapodya prolifera JEL478]|uniref:Glycoside hydrolase family 5 protein n=1 Tax=Gonapodya prolifera (strain JEL478) TaxID=1344416 RepID=A0A139AFP5_GONPJ|nr:glycoside hydrolase family 5 protein [Gonapodya prolifera JEL478]|eukprot:KXS15233.1 glycoside hydrolase family 5 protein [Gonapodya prolifera JEL478]